ncbi:murein transglycosylase A [Ketobacter sp.]|uniref:murein transglycosylase A n=1 Tax=Ketobacter sp. TaxID=2083498 RepID=UPI0025C06D30|nr:murein transglycosylase A [Ketobacter sp.]
MFKALAILFFTLLVASCATTPKTPSLTIAPSTFKALPGWGQDNLTSFTQAFNRSCTRIQKLNPAQPFSSIKEAGSNGQWQSICSQFKTVNADDPAALKQFFETHFKPYQITNNGDSKGLFTGYFEASLNGSRTPKAPYLTPLHQRPDDLIMVQLGDFRSDLKGQRIAGRVINGKLTPYETRKQITTDQWPHPDSVLLWVDDPVDAFFTQIQGSGVVEMDDGSEVRIGYAGHNGHPYYAIGRELIKMGVLSKETVSMQSIRQWLDQNPDQAATIMNTNQSYVFFREVSGAGPIGAEGIALTAQRSLAVDPSWLPYGLPLWVDIEPVPESDQPIRRLMIAQDTGGAIRGPVRGDVFWGHGEAAAAKAGKMNSQGRYWGLFPVGILVDSEVVRLRQRL